MAGKKGRSGRKPLAKYNLSNVYELYTETYNKQVQSQYRKLVERLTPEQLVTKLNTYKGHKASYRDSAGNLKQFNIWSKSGELLTTGVTKFITSQIRTGYTWTRARLDAVISNINDYINRAFLASTGRKDLSQKGRVGEMSMVGDATLDAVLTIMIRYHGFSHGITTYRITEQDVLLNTPYYQDMWQTLRNCGIDADDIWGS